MRVKGAQTTKRSFVVCAPGVFLCFSFLNSTNSYLQVHYVQAQQRHRHHHHPLFSLPLPSITTTPAATPLSRGFFIITTTTTAVPPQGFTLLQRWLPERIFIYYCDSLPPCRDFFLLQRDESTTAVPSGGIYFSFFFH